MRFLKEVYPHKGESKKDFIARFMSVTKDEYPDEKQRYAVANSYWDRKDKNTKEQSTMKNKTEGIKRLPLTKAQSLQVEQLAEGYRRKLKEESEDRKPLGHLPAQETCYNALMQGSMDTDQIIREVAMIYGLTREQAVDAFRRAHNRYEMQMDESLNEASYGGAFDIADDQYFSREQLDEFGYKLEDRLNKELDSEVYPVEYSRVYIDGNTLLVDVYFGGEGDFTESTSVKIDFRKVKTERDLEKYIPEIVSNFQDIIEKNYRY